MSPYLLYFFGYLVAYDLPDRDEAAGSTMGRKIMRRPATGVGRGTGMFVARMAFRGAMGCMMSQAVYSAHVSCLKLMMQLLNSMKPSIGDSRTRRYAFHRPVPDNPDSSVT